MFNTTFKVYLKIKNKNIKIPLLILWRVTAQKKKNHRQDSLKRFYILKLSNVTINVCPLLMFPWEDQENCYSPEGISQ